VLIEPVAQLKTAFSHRFKRGVTAHPRMLSEHGAELVPEHGSAAFIDEER
jgi:hypothetical protein